MRTIIGNNYFQITQKRSIEENGWIPKQAITAFPPSLKAVFVGSVGHNEPKWRSFWVWHQEQSSQTQQAGEETDNNSNSLIPPESQSSIALPPSIMLKNDNDEHVKFLSHCD